MKKSPSWSCLACNATTYSLEAYNSHNAVCPEIKMALEPTKPTNTKLPNDPFAQMKAAPPANYVGKSGEVSAAYPTQVLKLSNITESPFNPRKSYDEDALNELAANLKETGLLQPITVRELGHMKGAYEIVFGHRRFRAAMKAGWTSISATVVDWGDRQAAEVQLVENLQREDVSSLEQAEGYRHLMQNRGLRAEDVAKKVGKSKAFVYAALKLLDLKDAARVALEQKVVDNSVALLIARLATEKMQTDAVMAVKGLTFKEAEEELRQRFSVNLARASFDQKDADLVPAAGACGPCPKRAGNIEGATKTDANVCTDVNCFNTKTDALWARITDEAKAKGYKVLTEGQMKNAVAYSYPRNGWATLDAEYQGDSKARSYKDLLGKRATEFTCVGRDDQGKTWKLIDTKNAQIAQVIEELHPEIRKARMAAKKKAEKEREASKQQDAEALLEEKTLSTAAELTAKALAKKATATQTASVMRFAIKTIFNNYGSEIELTAAVLGVKVAETNDEASFTKLLEKVKDSELTGVLLAMIVDNTYQADARTKLLKDLGADMKGAKVIAKRELDAPAKLPKETA